MTIKQVTARETVADWIAMVENKKEYVKRQYDVAISTFLHSNKRTDRDKAMYYKAKLDALDEILTV